MKWLKRFLLKFPFLKKIILFIYYLPKFAYGYICFPLCGILRLCYALINKNYYSNLRKLKDSHKGERCFIIATGPSLTINDINLLKNEYTFALNSFYRVMDKIDWIPSCYVCADIEFLSNVETSFFQINKCKEYFFTDIQVKRIVDKFNMQKIIYLHYNRLLHGIKTFLDYNFLYSRNPIFGIYDYHTVTILALNIAKYMGFKEIYLIGCDCSYLKKHHSDGMEDPVEELQSKESELYVSFSMKEGYKYIHKKFKSDKIQVYNATRGGELEVFPRVNLDEVLKNDNSNQ